MASKIEVLTPVESILDSSEPDDVKVKRMLTAMYHIIKKQQKPSTELTTPNNEQVEKAWTGRRFNYQSLPPDANVKLIRRIVSSLPKSLTWDHSGQIIHKGEAIPNSNISDLVLYLSGHRYVRPSWYSKVLKFINEHKLKQRRKSQKKVQWETYNAPREELLSSPELTDEE